jgi:hypothetical protein
MNIPVALIAWLLSVSASHRSLVWLSFLVLPGVSVFFFFD